MSARAVPCTGGRRRRPPGTPRGWQRASSRQRGEGKTPRPVVPEVYRSSPRAPDRLGPTGPQPPGRRRSPSSPPSSASPRQHRRADGLHTRARPRVSRRPRRTRRPPRAPWRRKIPPGGSDFGTGQVAVDRGQSQTGVRRRARCLGELHRVVTEERRPTGSEAAPPQPAGGLVRPGVQLGEGDRAGGRDDGWSRRFRASPPRRQDAGRSGGLSGEKLSHGRTLCSRPGWRLDSPKLARLARP